MKQAIRVSLFAAAISILFVTAASAGPVDAPLKWSQPPVQIGIYQNFPLYTGWDEPSWAFQPPPVGPPQAADDWRCKDKLPVTDFHWWGSYVNWREKYSPFPPVGFWFGIYKDVPGDPTHFSHPGDLLWQHATTAYKETFIGYDGFFNADGTVSIIDSMFQYNVSLPQTAWYYQTGQDSILWLSIVALYPNGTNWEWGWKTRPHIFQDDAVRRLAGAAGWSPIYGPDNLSWDLSFEISTIPEPGSLMALGTGLVGLIGFAIRRKRSPTL